MPLVRYRGPLAALRGVVGRLTADGRVRLRGAVRDDVRPADLERPRYWVQADGDWTGPFNSWEVASRFLCDVLAIWGVPAPDGIGEAQPEGWTGYAAGCRLRIIPGGDTAPVDSQSDCL